MYACWLTPEFLSEQHIWAALWLPATKHAAGGMGASIAITAREFFPLSQELQVVVSPYLSPLCTDQHPWFVSPYYILPDSQSSLSFKWTVILVYFLRSDLHSAPYPQQIQRHQCSMINSQLNNGCGGSNNREGSLCDYRVRPQTCCQSRINDYLYLGKAGCLPICWGVILDFALLRWLTTVRPVLELVLKSGKEIIRIDSWLCPLGHRSNNSRGSWYQLVALQRKAYRPISNGRDCLLTWQPSTKRDFLFCWSLRNLGNQVTQRPFAVELPQVDNDK